MRHPENDLRLFSRRLLGGILLLWGLLGTTGATLTAGIFVSAKLNTPENPVSLWEQAGAVFPTIGRTGSFVPTLTPVVAWVSGARDRHPERPDIQVRRNPGSIEIEPGRAGYKLPLPY